MSDDQTTPRLTPAQRIAWLETQLDAERRRVPGRYAFYHRHLAMSRVRQRDPELANWASVEAGHYIDLEGGKSYQDVVAVLEGACEAWDQGFVDGEDFDADQFLAWVNRNRAQARAALKLARGES